MYRFITALLFLLLGAIVYGQTRQIDSLRNAAAEQKDLLKVRTLNYLSESLLPLDVEKAQATVNEAYKLARKFNDYSGQARSLENFGAIFLSKFDYNQAMNSFVEALKIGDDLGDKKGQARARNYIGQVYFLQADYPESEQHLLKALELWRELKDISGESDAHYTLGKVYLEKDEYAKAKDYLRKASDQKLASRDAKGGAEIAQKLGQLSIQLGEYAPALTHFQTCLKVHTGLQDIANMAKDQTQIALVFLAQHLPKEALAANKNAYTLHLEKKDTPGMAENLAIFGKIELGSGNTKQAEAYFDKSFALLKKSKPAPGSPEILHDISRAYAKLNLYPKAYEAQTVFSANRDVVSGLEKSKALLELTMRYDSEFATKEQQQTIERLELDNSTDKKIRTFLFLLIVVIGALGVNLYLSNKRGRRDNALLMEKNEKINLQKSEINFKNLELKQKNQSLDILNKKLLEEIAERESIERSSFARDRFLATMSHQMRTPLNVIVGMTHILLESSLHKDQEESLRALQFSANDLVVFINDVLDFSKIEAGKLNLEDREFTPAKIFKDLFERFGKSAEETGAKFSYNYDQTIPDKLWGDNTRLTQILTNLYKQALQNGEAGSLKIDVSLKKIYQKEALLEINIENSSGSVDPNLMEELLAAQQDWENFDGYNSKHLSLVISKRLIELQKGKLNIGNPDGKGIWFNALLPFKLMPELQKDASYRVPSDMNYESLAGNKILVVEDNKINQLVVAKLLRKLDLEVITADNGMLALEVFDDHYFDLVLMDIQMPEMDGYRATAEIRRHPDEQKRDVPVIALTASAFLTEKEKAKLFGMNDHIAKPFSPEELLEKISACLEFCKNA